MPSTEWYAQNVQAAYEYKLVDGVNATQFKPNSNLTIAQAIKLAACLHSTYVSARPILRLRVRGISRM